MLPVLLYIPQVCSLMSGYAQQLQPLSSVSSEQKVQVFCRLCKLHHL